MKKNLLFILSLLLCIDCFAQQSASSLTLTHCDGVLSTTGLKGCSGAQWNSAAVCFSEDMMKRYEGNDISAVRVGISSKLNVEELTFWVRTDLNGENLAEASTTDIVKGWIELSFAKPYHIEKASDVYVGVSYRQKGSSKCIGAIADKKVKGGFYFRQADNDWEDCSTLGVACIEGFVTGDNLPQYDLMLEKLDIAKNYLTGSELEVDLSVRNKAAATVKGFTTRISVDDATPIDVHHDCSIAYDEVQKFHASVLPAGLKQKMDAKVTVEIVGIDGGEDIDMQNNALQTEINILSKEYKRHMLIEEFTTERCVNCPGAASLLHQLLEDPTYSERVTAVCHHAGFYTDWLTADNAQQYLWFYGSSSTYAPAFMFDRMLIQKETVPVTMCPQTLKDMKAIVDERLSTTTLCEVNAEAEYDDASRMLRVNVRGERSAEFCNTPARVTVFVTEDNIQAQNQQGATTSPYYHQHAMRTYNAAFGSVIEWNDDDTFDYDCQMEILPEWNHNNMHVVAFISGYDANDVTNCVIENSCEIAFPTGDENAIHNAYCNATRIEMYNIAGQRITNASHSTGITIIHTKDGRTRKSL